MKLYVRNFVFDLSPLMWIFQISRDVNEYLSTCFDVITCWKLTAFRRNRVCEFLISPSNLFWQILHDFVSKVAKLAGSVNCHYFDGGLRAARYFAIRHFISLEPIFKSWIFDNLNEDVCKIGTLESIVLW